MEFVLFYQEQTFNFIVSQITSLLIHFKTKINSLNISPTI